MSDYKMPEMAKFSTPNKGTPQGKRNCRKCLWHWPVVTGEGGYRCYHSQSPRYHEESTIVCPMFESKVVFAEKFSERGTNGKR